MPFNNFGVSNLSRVLPLTQQDNPETVTTILGSNIIDGKRSGEEGIFYKQGDDYSLIRGKRILTGSSYYYIGSERTRDDGVLIYPTIPKALSLSDKGQLIYKGGVQDGL